MTTFIEKAFSDLAEEMAKDSENRINALKSCTAEPGKRYGIEFNFTPEKMLFHIHFYYCKLEMESKEEYANFYDVEDKIIFRLHNSAYWTIHKIEWCKSNYYEVLGNIYLEEP